METTVDGHGRKDGDQTRARLRDLWVVLVVVWLSQRARHGGLVVRIDLWWSLSIPCS